MAIATRCVCGRNILEQEQRCRHCGTSQEGVIIHQLLESNASTVATLKSVRESFRNYVNKVLRNLQIMSDLLHNR